jgi:hypothetical protein
MSLLSATASRIANLFGYIKAKEEDRVDYGNRENQYRVNRLLYSGDIYATRSGNGALEDVLSTFVGAQYTNVNKHRIFPFFLPFREIVDTYQNVMPGTWGEGVQVADEVDGKPVNPKLTPALAQVWKDSNLDTAKGTLIQWAANFGTVGLRITASEAQGNSPARAVIQPDHPSRLFNFEEDSRGNVVAVVLKYSQPVNFGTLVDPDWQNVDVVETFDKDEFSRTQNGKQTLEDGQRRNTLGFCPYVILRHRDNGTAYGDWAYKGSESVVHRINWRISRQDKSIDRNQFPRWFGAGAGDKPESVAMDDDRMTWVKLHPDSPNPLLQAIVPDLDQASTQAFWQAMRDMLRGRQPELNLNDMQLIANVSGDAMAQAKAATEKAILDVRPGYLHAVNRSLSMATSAGIAVGAFDIGTGTGPENADKAFRDGLENFAFQPMPALPLTPAEKEAKAKADVAERLAKFELAAAAGKAGVSKREQLRVYGYDSAMANRIIGEKALEDVEQAASTPNRAGGASAV